MAAHDTINNNPTRTFKFLFAMSLALDRKRNTEYITRVATP